MAIKQLGQPTTNSQLWETRSTAAVGAPQGPSGSAAAPSQGLTSYAKGRLFDEWQSSNAGVTQQSLDDALAKYLAAISQKTAQNTVQPETPTVEPPAGGAGGNVAATPPTGAVQPPTNPVASPDAKPNAMTNSMMKTRGTVPQLTLAPPPTFTPPTFDPTAWMRNPAPLYKPGESANPLFPIISKPITPTGATGTDPYSGIMGDINANKARENVNKGGFKPWGNTGLMRTTGVWRG